MAISFGVRYERAGGMLAIFSALAITSYIWPAAQVLHNQGVEIASVLGILCLIIHLIVWTDASSYHQPSPGDPSAHVVEHLGCGFLIFISYILAAVALLIHLFAGQVKLLIMLFIALECLRRLLNRINKF